MISKSPFASVFKESLRFMSRLLVSTSLALSILTGVSAYADDPVFKSDVAMTRVDAQVVDRNGRPITGLQKSDFVVKVDGHIQPIRNFASENMPIDILLLLDVSGSMEPHVEKIARAAHQALRVLADKDRVAIMVFDTSTRVRLPFTGNLDDVASELNHVLRAEHFNGGTRITNSLVSAATYVGRQARPEARRAIVILTDDETQDSEDEPRVESALARANTVLSFLEAPYEVPTMSGRGVPRRHGTWGSGGGVGFPGGGGGWPGGGGGGWPAGGGGIPGGGLGGDPSHTAGTSTIAQDSGGDTMQVQEASALEDTLARLRQRYALHFYLPEGAQVGDRQSVRVELSQEAKIRFLDSEIHYRRVFISGNSAGHAGPISVTRASDPGDPIPDPASSSQDPATPATSKHRAAVNEDSGPHINTVTPDGDNSAVPPAATPAPTTPAPKTGGWPKANPN